MIYFDNAATTFPKPRQLGDAMQEYLIYYGANPGRGGHDMSLQTSLQIFETREAVARLFHAEQPEQIIFTQNCTHALNLALHGLLRWGDHVVLSDLEHNSVLRPIHRLWQKQGVQYTVARTFEGDDDATVGSFRACLRSNTKLIVCTHGSNAFGMKQPIARIAALAHSVGAKMLADCAQTAGLEPIDVTAMGLDYVAMPGHKGLYGPTGTGILIVGCDTGPDPLMQGGTGSNSLSFDQPDFLPDQLESGTVNTAGILGLKAGLAELESRGLEAVRAHEMELIRVLYDGMAAIPGVTLYTRRPTDQHHLPVLSFTVGRQHSEDTARSLNEYAVATRGGYHCSPLAHQKMGTTGSGTVRISLGMYNTRQEADDFLEILKHIAR